MAEPEATDQTVRHEGEGEIIASRYHTSTCLGTGGMGTVFLAEDTTLRRPVAIKTIREDLTNDVDFGKRIDRECLLHAKVGAHPHIVTLFDKIEDRGRIHLIMEYVEGMDLEELVTERLSRGSGLSPGEAVAVCMQCLDALARIHAHGVVHRDIKPGNIMVGREDTGGISAKLMDFGIARLEEDTGELSRLTRTQGASPGTPLYMAPEQIDPQTFGSVTGRTDVYAVGVMLYQLLSGHPPFTGTITQVLNGHVNAEPPALEMERDLPVPVGVLVRKALAKYPGERFESAMAFRDALDGVLDELKEDGADGSASQTMARTAVLERPGETIVAATTHSSEPTPGQTIAAGTTTAGVPPRASRLPAVLGVAVVIAAVAVGGYVLWRSQGNGGGTEPVGGPSQQAESVVNSGAEPASELPAVVPAVSADISEPVGEVVPPEAGQSSAMDALLAGGDDAAPAEPAQDPPKPAEPPPDATPQAEPEPVAAVEPSTPDAPEPDTSQDATAPAGDPKQASTGTTKPAEEPKKEEPADSSSGTSAKKNPWADVKAKYSAE